MSLLLRLELPFALLPFWYDVDRPEDLVLLRNHLANDGETGPLPVHTIGILDELRSHD